MSMLKTIALSQLFTTNKIFIIKMLAINNIFVIKILAANKIDNIKGNNKLIEKFIKLNTRKSKD